MGEMLPQIRKPHKVIRRDGTRKSEVRVRPGIASGNWGGGGRVVKLQKIDVFRAVIPSEDAEKWPVDGRKQVGIQGDAIVPRLFIGQGQSAKIPVRKIPE